MTHSETRPPVANPNLDSLGTRLRRVFAETGLSMTDAAAADIARRVERLYDENEEIVRLRVINSRLVDSHNALISALARVEDDARIRIDKADNAAEAAFKVHRLIRQARQRAADAAAQGDAAAAALGQVEVLLTAAVDLLDAHR